MIRHDIEHYIYEKRDKIREYIVLLLLIKAVYSFITKYNEINKTTVPIEIETFYSVIFIWINLAILKTASSMKAYAHRKNINIRKIKYLKTFDKLLFYIYIISSLGNVIIIIRKKKASSNEMIRLFFNLFFLIITLFYYNFLF